MTGEGTATVPSAKASPACNLIGLTNIQMRTVTICIAGPAVIAFGAYSLYCATLLACFAMFICGIEWNGVKRHLKVALLMSMGNAATSTSQSPHIEGEPLYPEVYALPVVPITLYNVLKHLGWVLLSSAAYIGEEAFLLMLEFYFLVFVVVTLVAHNRLKLNAEHALERLCQQLSFCLQSSSRGVVGHVGRCGGVFTAAAALNAGPDLSLANQRETKEALVAKAQRDYFLLTELQMIAERQPAEQLLDFCLDIFGMLWIAGLTTPLCVYHITNVGLPWAASTLISNFVNDIFALVVGRSLKALRERYGRIYDVTSEDPPASGAANQPGKRPLTEASRLMRVLLRSPHPLYPDISPNKSVEGAAAGVVMNAVSFAGLMFWSYRTLFAAPAPNIVNPAYQSVALWLLLGVIMGVLGVCGDLLQSLLKRAARLKDTGVIIPGHGGLLDRVDGMLLVFPFMHCALRIIMRLSSDL
ncbi:phosphatidate cytidylyltransferase-like protein [Leishmania guyanensis]|uniref:Phosphatidate cytidylyltransferase n=1 Tax=Leishmania guyanensis TaxID=5670 RepID=A0A1E1J447_LEIGU|nr:Putative phosphatidate cytidylyltransferase-like protein [Leishmania guyanensis]